MIVANQTREQCRSLMIWSCLLLIYYILVNRNATPEIYCDFFRRMDVNRYYQLSDKGLIPLNMIERLLHSGCGIFYAPDSLGVVLPLLFHIGAFFF